MWKNIVELDRPQMTVWRIRIACWITKATDTHLEYVNTYCFYATKMGARTLLNVMLYVLWLYCVSRPGSVCVKRKTALFLRNYVMQILLYSQASRCCSQQSPPPTVQSVV
jgi:hypothetical protein